MFQKCPSCGGSGLARPMLSTTITIDPCTVCKGRKIISQLTGKPPEADEDKPKVEYMYAASDVPNQLNLSRHAKGEI